MIIVLLILLISLFIHLSRQGKVQQLKKWITSKIERFKKKRRERKIRNAYIEMQIGIKDLEDSYRQIQKDHEAIKRRFKKTSREND